VFERSCRLVCRSANVSKTLSRNFRDAKGHRDEQGTKAFFLTWPNAKVSSQRSSRTSNKENAQRILVCSCPCLLNATSRSVIGSYSPTANSGLAHQTVALVPGMAILLAVDMLLPPAACTSYHCHVSDEGAKTPRLRLRRLLLLIPVADGRSNSSTESIL
jgi:hypothetical protein